MSLAALRKANAAIAATQGDHEVEPDDITVPASVVAPVQEVAPSGDDASAERVVEPPVGETDMVVSDALSVALEETVISRPIEAESFVIPADVDQEVGKLLEPDADGEAVVSEQVEVPAEAEVAVEAEAEVEPEAITEAPALQPDAPESSPVPDEPQAVEPQAEPSSIDQELAGVAVERDIASEVVAPSTRTEEEVEAAAKAAAATLGSDVAAPAQEATAAAPADAEAAVHGAPAADGEAAPSQASASEEAEFVFGDKEAADLGVPADVARMIATLPAAQARQFVEGLRAERSGVAAAAKEGSDRRRQPGPYQGGGGGFSLFGGLAGALGSGARAIGRVAKGKKTDPATQLSPDNIRARIEEMRRTEILDHAARVSRDHVGLTEASKTFNQALLATDAGKAFEAKVGEIAAANPTLDRRKIMEMSMNGTLASAIGSDPLKPLVDEAFKSAPVRDAWSEMERHADGLEKNGKQMLERMKAFEEHFPKSVDTDRLNKVVEEAMEGIEKSFDEAIAQSPEAKRAWKERLEELAKQIREFVDRMLAKFGLGSR